MEIINNIKNIWTEIVETSVFSYLKPYAIMLGIYFIVAGLTSENFTNWGSLLFYAFTVLLLAGTSFLAGYTKGWDHCDNLHKRLRNVTQDMNEFVDKIFTKLEGVGVRQKGVNSIRIVSSTPIEEDNKPIKSRWMSVCNDCGQKLYGDMTKRDMGVITMHMGECENCGENKAIIPARDWRYACMSRPTAEDWD